MLHPVFRRLFQKDLTSLTSNLQGVKNQDLTREVTDLKNGSRTGYKRLIASRYICIREESEGKPGILLKVLGKATKDDMLIVSGEPFCKDDADELCVPVENAAHYRLTIVYFSKGELNW